jgi:hypothetical protein
MSLTRLTGSTVRPIKIWGNAHLPVVIGVHSLISWSVSEIAREGLARIVLLFDSQEFPQPARRQCANRHLCVRKSEPLRKAV